MKSIITSLLICLTINVFAQFSGYYDPANWGASVTGCGSGGGVDASGAPASVTLTSNDSPGGCGFSVVAYSITTVCGSICFDWSYLTTDCDGPNYDRFGYMVNGVPTQLSNNNGANSQSGSACADVSPGDVFAFYQNATDTYCGSASTTVSNLSGPDDICHDENGNPKVEICHNGNTICVAPAAVAAHLAHGDFLGPCCSEEGEGGMQAHAETLDPVADNHEEENQLKAGDYINQLYANLQDNTDQKGLSIYPNPVSALVNIEVKRMSGAVDISVIDINGNVVLKSKAEINRGASVQLSTENLKEGVYDLRVTSLQGVTYTDKLIVLRQ